MVSLIFVVVLALGSTVIEGLKEDVPSCYEVEGGGKCEGKLDIQLVIDASNNYVEDDFTALKDTIKDKFLSQFKIGLQDTNIAITNFGVMAGVQTSSVSLGIDVTLLDNLPRIGGESGVAAGMESVLQDFKAKARSNAKQVCLVFVAGDSTEANLTPVAQQWAEQATLLVVGMNSTTEMMNKFSNNTDNLYQVEKVAEVDDIIQTLVKRSCHKTRKTDCQLCRAKAYMVRTTMEEGFIPKCDASKINQFAAKQCYDSECWCVTETGHEINGTRQSDAIPMKTPCETARDEHMENMRQMSACEVQRSKKEAFMPECNSLGKYKPVQCLNDIGYCWCSKTSGIAIPSTIYHKNDAEKPKCLKHRDLRFDCKKAGKKHRFYDHPFDSFRFMNCGAGGKVYACSCPDDLIFEDGLCVYNPDTQA